MSRAGRVRAGCVLGLLAASCASAPPRGYYTPYGTSSVETNVACVRASSEGQLDVRCQGVYWNIVDGEEVRTVHMQLDIRCVRADALVLAREGLEVELTIPGPSAPRSLAASEAWMSSVPVPGDLKVEGWTSQGFDVFFDEAVPHEEPLPERILLRWRSRDGSPDVSGQCDFEVIKSFRPFYPGGDVITDMHFGLRGGYYLPGPIRLGMRQLRPGEVGRVHPLFHEPTGWGW